MNLSNASRSQLSKIPGLNRAIDFICGRANEVFSKEHDPETGLHAKVTFLLGAATAWLSGAGVYMAASAARGIADTRGAYDLRVGDPAGNYFAWDGVSKTLIVVGSGTFTGTITASGGSIGGWVITADAIKDAAGLVGLLSTVTGGDDIRFFAGNVTPASAPFRVTESGALVATSATISGSITATTGTIGGWVIGVDSIKDVAGLVGLLSTVTGGDDIRFFAGNATPSSAPFKVTEAGLLTATSVSLTGGTTVLDGSGLTLGSTAGNSAYVTASSLKFVRPSANQYGQTGDRYGLYSIANGSDEDLWLDNTIVGNTTASGKSRVVLNATGWNSGGGGSATTTAGIVVRSEIGVCRVSIVATDTQISGQIFERGRSDAMGEWATFTPTRTASTGTWTAGTVVTAHYTLVGKTMIISVAIDGANNSNITAQLLIAIPGGFTASKAEYAVPLIEDNGVFVANTRMRTTAGGTTILFENLAGNIAANAANGLTVRGQLSFEVQ